MALKQQIERSIKDIEKIEYPLNDRETIETTILEISNNMTIPLSYEITLSGNNSSDWWLQANYYSNKIKYTIILDYDVNSSFEDETELIDTLIYLEKQSITLEKLLPKLK